MRSLNVIRYSLMIAVISAIFMILSISYHHGFASDNQFHVLIFKLSGGISPVKTDGLQAAVDECSSRNYQFLLIELDTPGGTTKSMRDMIQVMLHSPVPVGIWVGPSGAQAASAGTFLVAASTVSGMAPGTTIGSASPVDMSGGEVSETMSKKVRNDLVSFITSLAKRNNRNIKWYKRAVTESANLSAEQAVMERVTEYIAQNPKDFLTQVGSKGIYYRGEPVIFHENSIQLHPFDPGFRYSFLSWLIDPSIAYFLLLGGMAGLFFELSTPGVVLPGVIGSICLILAFYSMSILPTNVAGILLMILGMIFFLLEIKVVSHGLLSVAGLACFFIGSNILFKFQPGLDPLSTGTILVTTGTISAAMAGTAYLVIKARRQPSNLGYNALIGAKGTIRTWSSESRTILVRGEIWSAKADESKNDTTTDEIPNFKTDDEVVVTGNEGLVLTISKPSN